MTYGASLHAGDKNHFEEPSPRPCNVSVEEGTEADTDGGGDGGVDGGGCGRFGVKLKCPLSRLRVEKIEGGLMVAGVVIATNCQIALPAFGFLFLLVGAVLTAASYRGPGEDEDMDSYAARIAFTGNSRVLGPICISVGAVMLALGCLLCVLMRRARRRERRIGFHCPLHGDFYPLSPAQAAKIIGNYRGWTKSSCFRGRGRVPVMANNGQRIAAMVGPPQCPHSMLSSTRSSVSSSPLSPCPTPMPFLVTSGSVSGMQISGAANLSPDQTFGSIRSLSVSREVASFPLSRTPTPPGQRRRLPSLPSCSSEEELSDELEQQQQQQQQQQPEQELEANGDNPVQAHPESVSITLPD